MKGQRRTMVGRVVSDKMDKTVVVAVESVLRHRIYGKTMRRVERYKAHNEDNTSKLGDLVRIEESRPISRDKRWAVIEILEHAK